jgi:hypothetical protein
VTALAIATANPTATALALANATANNATTTRTEQLRKLGILQSYYLDKFHQTKVFICRKQ